FLLAWSRISLRSSGLLAEARSIRPSALEGDQITPARVCGGSRQSIDFDAGRRKTLCAMHPPSSAPSFATPLQPTNGYWMGQVSQKEDEDDRREEARYFGLLRLPSTRTKRR